MPDHLHLIAHQGHEAVRLGQWIKALKAVVGGLERRADSANAAGSSDPAGSGDPAYTATAGAVGGLLPAGVGHPHEFTRLKRAWRWQEGFHDHKFRTPESEQRKWEYVCLNPVRYRLVERPEQWPYGGEIFHDEPDGPRLVQGTPPLLEVGLLIEEEEATGGDDFAPAEGSRPTRKPRGDV
jgi:hypothetical protein